MSIFSFHSKDAISLHFVGFGFVAAPYRRTLVQHGQQRALHTARMLCLFAS